LAEIIMGVTGMDSPGSRLAAASALHKYSGVLEVDVSENGGEIRVRYDPGNITAGDLKELLEGEGLEVIFVTR